MATLFSCLCLFLFSIGISLPPSHYSLFMGCWVKWANGNISKAKWQIQMNHRRSFCILVTCHSLAKKCKWEPRPFVTMGTSEGKKMEGHHHEENNYTALVRGEWFSPWLPPLWMDTLLKGSSLFLLLTMA